MIGQAFIGQAFTGQVFIEGPMIGKE